MKDILKKIEKNDIIYLFTLGIFVVIGIFRFYDGRMLFHEAPISILYSLGINKLAMATLIACMFIFFLVGILKSKKEDKKTMYYLCAFLSVFVVPMFSTFEYLGTMDMYAWIMMFLIALCFLCDKSAWLSIPITFVMLFISPMSVFNCGILVIVLSLYSVLNIDKKSNIILLVLNIIAVFGAVVLSISKYGLHTDAQYVLSIKKFIVMVGMHLPYLLIAVVFFAGLIKKSAGRQAITWIVFVLGSIPSIVVNMYIGDYTRAFLYTFMYFILGVMCFIVRGDSSVISQMNETKERVKMWVPIPAVLVAYPLLFITFWIAGPIVLFTEVFTG